jgi:hypothetical protein
MLLQLLRDTHKEKRDTHKGPSGHRPAAAETVLAVVPGSNAAAAAAQRFTLTLTDRNATIGFRAEEGPQLLKQTLQQLTALKGGMGPHCHSTICCCCCCCLKI